MANNPAISLGYVEALQKQGLVGQAIPFLEQRILQLPQAPRFHQLLAQALDKRQQPVEAREAMAQYYILVGALSSAVDQLQQARSLSTDFYQQSKLDVQIRDLRERLERDRLLLERFKG